MEAAARRSPALALVLVLAIAVQGVRAADPPADPPASAAEVEARLRRLEEMNARLVEQNEAIERSRAEDSAAAERRYSDLEKRYDDLKRKVESGGGLPPALSDVAGPAPALVPGGPRERIFAGAEAAEALRPPLFGAPGGVESGRPGAGAGEQPRVIGLMSKGLGGPELPLRPRLGDGFTLASEDDEFELRLRVLDQNDGKVFVPNDQDPARSGLYIPRVRVYFEGRLTRPFEYEVSLQRSVEGVWDLLDANANFVFSERFQLRFGRMLVPYSYAWYDHLEQYFIAPERALFPLNFGLSRSSGLEAHGTLAGGRLEYALGMFDGHLADLADANSIRDGVAYLNARPFLDSDDYPALRNLNIGASGFLGQQLEIERFLPLRTSIQSSENDEAAQAASTVFFQFDDLVSGLGSRSAAAAHAAWYWRGWSFEAEIQATRFDVVKAGRPGRTEVPVAGGDATLSYFLTGEHVTGRGPLEPLRPFDPFHGQYGPGALEFYGRYSQLGIGRSVFEDELADPSRWTRDIYMTDIGVNWYLNRYMKIYFDWQHSNFGSPVLLDPGSGQYGRFSDLFWVRCQIYF
jgi:phosphate-selective porin OprO/OprP